MRYARIDWLIAPPRLRQIFTLSTPPQGIRLEDGKPVLIPVQEQAEPEHIPLTQRITRQTAIAEAAYLITYTVVNLTAEEIEAQAAGQEEAIDGRLVNRLLRQQVNPDEIPPEEADDYAALFPVWRFNFYAYRVGDIVQYEGMVWRCIQQHNSQSDWSPPVVPALWNRLAEPGNPEWGYPIAYVIGDIVTFNGVRYRCRQAHTSQAGWSPPVVPALWEVVV